MEAFGYSNNGRKLLTLREVTLHLSKMELDRLIEFLMIVRSRHQEIALEIGEQEEEINPDEPLGFTPYLLLIVSDAPCANKKSVIAGLTRYRIAKNNGVFPSLSCASTIAPSDTNIETLLRSSSITAQCNAVRKYRSLAFTSIS